MTEMKRDFDEQTAILIRKLDGNADGSHGIEETEAMHAKARGPPIVVSLPTGASLQSRITRYKELRPAGCNAFAEAQPASRIYCGHSCYTAIQFYATQEY